MPLQDRKLKCDKLDGVHLFDIVRQRLGVTCRCGQRKQDFEYLQGYNLTVRVKIKGKSKINFSGVN